MNALEIILVGGGGHCKSCIEVIESGKKYRIAGILDARLKKGDNLLGYPVLGSDEDEDIINKFRNFLITVGHIKDVSVRVKLFEYYQSRKVRFPVILASTAQVSRFATIQEGTIIMHHALVNAGARIGRNNIINSGAIVEHEVTTGDHTQISTSCVVNGQVTIGSRCFIGSNAVVNNNISICDNVVVGAGSVVIHDITQPGIYAGNPARRIQ